MSAEATFWAWMMGVKPASCKLVLLCLADCHNSDTGRCDPSAKFIAEFTGLDKKTVPEALCRLQAMGLITPQARPGHSTQFILHIAENPVPAREKGERKKVVPIRTPKQLGLTQNRGTPKTGIPENGVPRNRIETPPENGVGGTPISGTEPTKNLQREPTSLTAATAAAADAALPVDNFTLPDLARIYASDEPETEIYAHGVPLLIRAGVEQHSARHFLGMLVNKHGAGRVLDALMVTILEMPIEPKAYLSAVCQKIGDEIPKDWVPPAPCLSELAGMGIPDDLVRKARDPFVIFFREQGIRHNNFSELFLRWCQRDWERVEGNASLFRQRLAASAGFGEEFREPA